MEVTGENHLKPYFKELMPKGDQSFCKSQLKIFDLQHTLNCHVDRLSCSGGTTRLNVGINLGIGKSAFSKKLKLKFTRDNNNYYYCFDFGSKNILQVDTIELLENLCPFIFSTVFFCYTFLITWFIILFQNKYLIFLFNKEQRKKIYLPIVS